MQLLLAILDVNLKVLNYLSTIYQFITFATVFLFSIPVCVHDMIPVREHDTINKSIVSNTGFNLQTVMK